mmetsp:Transcript_137579/g.243120  ORF Transcript_137579/g.243120 Transcript_137579/m.243120 type:complete len:337 (+) Transcript_137579:49-1059(+)
MCVGYHEHMPMSCLVTFGSFFLTQIHEVSGSRMHMKKMVELASVDVGQQGITMASTVSAVGSTGTDGMRNSSIRSDGAPQRSISAHASALAPSLPQSLMQASAHGAKKLTLHNGTASPSSDGEQSATQQDREANVRFPPRLLAVAGKKCLQEGPEKNLGCSKCSCSWSQQCYPKFLQWEEAVINVGICSTSMPLLCFASFVIFVLLLVTFIACRTLLQWLALEKQDKADEEAMHRPRMTPVPVQAPAVSQSQAKKGTPPSELDQTVSVPRSTAATSEAKPRPSPQGDSSPAPTSEAQPRPSSETAPPVSPSSVDPAQRAEVHEVHLSSDSNEVEVL